MVDGDSESVNLMYLPTQSGTLVTSEHIVLDAFFTEGPAKSCIRELYFIVFDTFVDGYRDCLKKKTRVVEYIMALSL
jgi:hypothetical protein